MKQRVVEVCREDLGDGYRCARTAEYLLWGKLIPPEGLGPRCYEHAANHVGSRSLGSELAQWAIFDLRKLYREES